MRLNNKNNVRLNNDPTQLNTCIASLTLILITSHQARRVNRNTAFSTVFTYARGLMVLLSRSIILYYPLMEILMTVLLVLVFRILGPLKEQMLSQ